MEAFKYCDLLTTAFKHELHTHFPQLIFIDCAKKFAKNHIVFASVAHLFLHLRLLPSEKKLIKNSF